MTSLGRLERVDLRTAWETEVQHFTPWLAEPDNLKILGDTIGLDLELEATEKDVGPFRADILCKVSGTSDWVLVENQLERTDHLHLGQLLTYAAGLQAVTIVWVASRFTDEHQATLDWLNDITDDRFRFFGLEVELWRIGDSPAAPKFNIISKPNDWSRSVGAAARRLEDEAVTETQARNRRYWTALREHLLNQGSPVRPQKPPKESWTQHAIGRTGFLLNATVNNVAKWVGVEIYIESNDAKAFFHLLKQDKEEIEREFGTALDWQELPGKKASRVVIRSAMDPAVENTWPEQHAWMADMLERFNRVFRPRVKVLDAAAWEGAEEAAAE